MEGRDKFVDFTTYCQTCVYRDSPESEDPCFECLKYPTKAYSHKPVYYLPDSKANATEFGYFEKKTKVKDYLHEIWYDALNYAEGYHYFKSVDEHIKPFGCSSVRNGNWYGRNFDWLYNDRAEFVIHVAPKFGKHGSIGIAGIDAINEEMASSDAYSDYYKVLPFFTTDGVNDAGLFCNMNVVPTDYGINRSRPSRNTRYEINGIMLPRFILDSFSDAYDAVTYISKYVSIFFPHSLHDQNYELHYMIGDSKSTYALEVLYNNVVIVDITRRPYMTNFHLSGVVVNPTGAVYTPETSTGKNNPVDYNEISIHGSGLERFNHIVIDYNHLDSKLGMRTLMNKLMYTKAYSTSTNPQWYTEFVGGSVHCNSPLYAFKSIMKKAREEYAKRDRNDPKTWQTVHSSVYDLETKTLYLVTQEDTGNEKTFSI